MDIIAIVERLGGAKRAAEALGIKHPSICGWIERGRVPAARVVEVSRLIGVPPHIIRDDIFPPPPGGV